MVLRSAGDEVVHSLLPTAQFLSPMQAHVEISVHQPLQERLLLRVDYWNRALVINYEWFE